MIPVVYYVDALPVAQRKSRRAVTDAVIANRTSGLTLTVGADCHTRTDAAADTTVIFVRFGVDTTSIAAHGFLSWAGRDTRTIGAKHASIATMLACSAVIGILIQL